MQNLQLRPRSAARSRPPKYGCAQSAAAEASPAVTARRQEEHRARRAAGSPLLHGQHSALVPARQSLVAGA
eukprot:15577203-Heterocapsa_arctica.AAC.1